VRSAAATRSEAQRYVGLAPLVKRGDVIGRKDRELETCWAVQDTRLHKGAY